MSSVFFVLLQFSQLAVAEPERYIVFETDQKSVRSASLGAVAAKTRYRLSGVFADVLIIESSLPKSKVLRRLSAEPSVRLVVPDSWVRGFSGSSDPALRPRPTEPTSPTADPIMQDRFSYAVRNTKAVEAWQKTIGSSSVVVANIDSGIDYNHPDLALNLWRNPNPSPQNDIVGYDFVNDDGLPWDDNGHGTKTAGVMGAVGFNGVGIVGISPRVSIMSLKFLNSSNSGRTSDALRAMDYAAKNGARVISGSWGSYGRGQSTPAIELAIRKLQDANILYVAPAGNKPIDNDVSSEQVIPASLDLENIVSVTSTDINDEKPSTAAWGRTTVDLGAPGARVRSTIVGGGYDETSGTSNAVPVVSGTLALMLAVNPRLNWRQQKAIILSSTDRAPYLIGRTVTEGRINVDRAVTLALRATSSAWTP
jgi:subtilisin family serine protease